MSLTRPDRCKKYTIFSKQLTDPPDGTNIPEDTVTKPKKNQ